MPRLSPALPLHALPFLTLLSLGAAWADPAGRFTLGLAEPWSIDPANTPLLEQQAMRASHLPTGGGLALRSWDAEALLALPRREARAYDVEATMSPDRLALLFAKSHEESLGEGALFVGPADGGDPSLGRWVYRDPAAPERVWWQVFWRSEDQVHQLVAWAPVARFGAFAEAMYAVEVSLERAEFAAPPTLLFDAGRDDCGAPIQADRSQAIRGGARFPQAREQLRAAWTAHLEGASPLPADAALRLGELATLDALYRGAESCVHAVARQRRACQVVEGPPDPVFQAALQSCVDGTPDLGPLIDAALAEALDLP